MDGGPFITLPQVYTEDPDRPGLARSNLGMYRVQLAGNAYEPGREIGLHYQIHRGIGVHHAAAIRRGEPLRVNVFVGGPPAMTVAAVMPLPEGLPELAFAGALGGRRVAMVAPDDGLPMPAEADFVIRGTIDPAHRKPEGPFGDHLGYYSLAHDFPVLRVESVYHRDGAIWPFTSVGRPPQEDTSFGELIHELTGPVIPSVIPGVRAVHAVDAAGVHPLLLAIASERYVPDAAERRPQEILTTANAILGQGQLSLAKYLWIVAHEDDPGLDIHDVPAFLAHVLRRVDWSNDLHFQTRTTIDTLDYSGHGLNQGSKVVIAAAGPVRRTLPAELPSGMSLPEDFRDPRVVAPRHPGRAGASLPARRRRRPGVLPSFGPDDPIRAFPLIVIVDDSEFTAQMRAELPLGDVHALRPGGGHRGHRRLHRPEALGLHRPAGHRRPDQAAPRPAAVGRPRGRAPRRCPGRTRTGPCTASTDAARGLAVPMAFLPDSEVVESQSDHRPREENLP